MLIEARNVWKYYGDYAALRGVNLSVRENEFLVIMGPSGSGKSTLLHILGLLDVPSKGKLYIFGKEAPKEEKIRAELRSKHIGFVFQDFGLINVLSALENVALPTIFAGKPNYERARELLEMLGLGDKLKNLPTQLSGGQKQRVAIARALVNDPELILADEPTGNLDSKTGKQVMELLRKLVDDFGKTVVVVTHDPEFLNYADRVARIKDGIITEVKEL